MVGEDAARAAYEAYRGQTGDVYDFHMLSQETRDAWCAAARAVLEYYGNPFYQIAKKREGESER